MYTPISTSKQSSKRKILQQLNQSLNLKVPENIRIISQHALSQTYNLNDKFKNLQDPLGFIHNNQLQKLNKNASQQVSKIKKQIDETCQFSKNIYKKIISSRQINQNNFENMKKQAQFMQKNERNQKQIMTSQKRQKSKEKLQNPMQMLIRQLKLRQISEKTKSSRGPLYYRHQREQVLQTQTQQLIQQLSYKHIKMLGSDQFENKCKNVEFFNILKKQQKKSISFEPLFEINNNRLINKQANQLTISLVGQSSEWGSNSKEIYFDFENNFTFWKQSSKNHNQSTDSSNLHKKQKYKDEKILQNFTQFNKKNINVNNVLELAIGKISLQRLKDYFTLKKGHQQKLKEIMNDENLEEKYDFLKKEYDYMQQNKMKIKSQRIPTKYTESDCQTIKILQQKDFDNYFYEDLKQIFEHIAALNKIRQQVLKNKHTKDKLVIAKNACIKIKQFLFKMLTYVLKGEKFYPRQVENTKYYTPYFTYNDLFHVQSQQKVERRILQLIYTKIEQFQCDQVDGVQKSELIRIYVEERQKNNRIIEMIDFMG